MAISAAVDSPTPSNSRSKLPKSSPVRVSGAHIDVWEVEPYNDPMKMTVEIDEKKLSRLMKLTGIKTKTKALNYALSAAERSARRDKLLSTSLAPKDLETAVDPRYDLLRLRAQERP